MEAQTALSSLKDIYTENGRISEYASIASKAGKSLSPEELDGMVLAAAKRGFDAGKLEQAITYYKQLREQTQTEEMRLVATVGEMRCAYGLKRYDVAIRAASDLIADSKVGPEEKSEAMFMRAESYYVTGKPAEAVADWQTLSADSRTEYGAQANVRLAEYAFNTNQYKAAEDLLVKFIDSGTPHAYWLARGFILLADVYNKTDRQVEAEQYLLSLKSNYSENEEINKMIEERMKEK
jgi:predicted Zn-dependent protease